MRVAITGSAGLIGGIVYDHLSKQGHDLIGIDRPHEDWLKAGRNTDDENARKWGNDVRQTVILTPYEFFKEQKITANSYKVENQMELM